MPLLVRLTDSEIDGVDHVVSQVSDTLKDVRDVVEEVGAVGLSIHQKALFPDLHIEPVYRNSELGGEFRG